MAEDRYRRGYRCNRRFGCGDCDNAVEDELRVKGNRNDKCGKTYNKKDVEDVLDEKASGVNSSSNNSVND